MGPRLRPGRGWRGCGRRAFFGGISLRVCEVGGEGGGTGEVEYVTLRAVGVVAVASNVEHFLILLP